jgi:hypothetical protein
MAVTYLIIVVAVLAAGVAIAIFIVVSIGVRREERLFTAERERRGVPQPRAPEEEPSSGATVEVTLGSAALLSAPHAKNELWRWLALTVGGTVLPFAVLGVAYWLTAGHPPAFQAVLGRGELFIPASIMNAEAIWILSYITLPGKSVWFPIMFATCGLAALGGAVCYGIAAALDSAPHNRVHVTQATLQQLARNVTVLSAGEFLLALVVGTTAVVLFMLVRREEGSAA